MYVGTSITDDKSLVRVSVLIDDKPQPLYKRMDGKVFVVGEAGTAYTLKVTNMSPGKIEVLAAIDQQDVLRRGPASLETSRGMLVPIAGTYTFRGWRLNDNEVGEFVFADPGDSVAGQVTQSIATTGIIGVAVFQEQYGYATRGAGGLESMPRSAPPVSFDGGFASKGAAPEMERSLGTGIGATLHDSVTHTRFVRSSAPPAVLAIGYHRYEVLDRWGIICPGEPEPFLPPTSDTGYGALKRVGY